MFWLEITLEYKLKKPYIHVSWRPIERTVNIQRNKTEEETLGHKCFQIFEERSYTKRWLNCLLPSQITMHEQWKFQEDECGFGIKTCQYSDMSLAKKPVHSVGRFKQRSEDHLARMEEFFDIYEDEILDFYESSGFEKQFTCPLPSFRLNFHEHSFLFDQYSNKLIVFTAALSHFSRSIWAKIILLKIFHILFF